MFQFDFNLKSIDMFLGGILYSTICYLSSGKLWKRFPLLRKIPMALCAILSAPCRPERPCRIEYLCHPERQGRILSPSF